MFKDLCDFRNFVIDNEIKFIDFKVIDLAGRWHHLTITASRFSEKILENGIGFDGSSYGFLTVEKSDMVFKPDLSSAFLDPFSEVPTLTMIGNIYALGDKTQRFEGDPRYVAEKAEKYMKKTGIADKALFGPELEFYILDHISYVNSSNHMEVYLDSEQAEWNTGKRDIKNLGFKVHHKEGYHVDIPYDVNFDLRNSIVLKLEEHGVPVKYHHPEVGGPGQLEIELSFGGLVEMADRTMLTKYIIKNEAVRHGKTVTLMPKPFLGEAGSGMHVHLQLFKNEEPIFYDEHGYSALSRTALYAIGGILKHSPALMAFTNPSTNSYKRLVPGYEAPVSICFATSNRSSVIRIPGYANKPEAKRFEFRPSDATCNPYLAYSALLMAMIDGIKNEIDPVKEGYGPYDVNIFDLSDEERVKIKGLPKSLEEAADALEKDYEFLLADGVFSLGIIKDQIKRMRQDASRVNMTPHPLEYEMYFDL
ncbi:type I glutamate--ammonia ligase [Paramaledivibacter caminithermalis]|jgi:glutamine synthetase|uniref:Glutamine synthetase n=1 Tax=Paramaledivibacter caminithermalis (strain DSM 15212 / CIP 107654 / DViRD3) TaxID=1121301 RepID=A0A1M6R3A4_PARC5|nr:type I glutamate--ammonia ligase [Paramaledivibacter caminithermalis]SHK26912.1 glutamine synthetase [Paramaledivibacter caminithermalis DSM 15212]